MSTQTAEILKLPRVPREEVEQQLGAVAMPAELYLSPNSMLWHYAADWRFAFTGLSTGELQLFHPEVGAGVVKQSNFFNQPWDRIWNSLPYIFGTIYDPDPLATAKEIVGFHTHVHGVDEQGRSYNALRAETFWWPHATFQLMVESIARRFSNVPLTPERAEQLYQEGVVWYRRYQRPMKPVPPTRQAFEEKLNDMYANVLEMTPAAERAIHLAMDGEVNRIPYFPKPLWALIGRRAVSEFARLTTIGGLPEPVRERFGISWSRRDETALHYLIEEPILKGWHSIPKPMRYHPRAIGGMMHAWQAKQAA